MMFIIIILTVLFILLIKKFTVPFMLFSLGIFIIPLFMVKDIIGLIVNIIGIILVAGYKFYLNREELPTLDFSSKIFSLHGIVNTFSKIPNKELAIGRIQPTNYKELKYNQKMVTLDNEIQRGHSMITGASGSGKTVALKSMMRQKLSQGHSVLWADMKGDVEVLDELQSIAKNLGIPYYEFSIRGCNFQYDPFLNLNETGKVEAFMNTRQWSSNGSDSHYKTSTQLTIQNIVRAYDMFRVENNDERNYLLGIYDFALNYKPGANEKDGHLTFIKQIEILLTSKAKELFSGNINHFTFEKESQYIVAFSFVSANKSLANSLMSFILQDVLDRGIRKRYTPELFICIDEFGTIDSPILIKDLVEKGRSGGCQVMFSILDINQLAMSTNDHFVNAILGTINSFIIFAGATQRTAEILAGVQKYENKDFDIMSLRKPYKGKPPTALIISKFPIVNKRANQEIFKIEPFIFKEEKKLEVIEEKPVYIEPIVEEPEVEEKLDTISNIDDFL